MDKQVDLPQKYLKLLDHTRKYLETHTNNLYQIELYQFGTKDRIVLGNFESRELKIQVSQMEKNYEELNGMYNNIDDIRKTITQNILNDVCEEFKEGTIDNQKYIIGKCKRCHTYDNKPRQINKFHCKKCSLNSYGSKWSRVQVDSVQGMIYVMENNKCVVIGRMNFLV